MIMESEKTSGEKEYERRQPLMQYVKETLLQTNTPEAVVRVRDVGGCNRKATAKNTSL